MSFRSAIQDFQLANPIYTGATVTFYTVDENGAQTETLATLYSEPVGTDVAANPQILDAEGKFTAPVYADGPLIAEIVSANVGSHSTGIINAQGTWRSGWAADTVYYTNDFVVDTDTGDIYVAAATHVSQSDIADDISDGNLVLVFDADSGGGGGGGTDIEAGVWGPFEDIASASTVNVGAATSMAVNITGSTGISSFGAAVNRLRLVKTAAAVAITAGASLISPVGSFTTAAGQSFIAMSDESAVWRLFGVGLEYLSAGVVTRTSNGFASRTLTGTAGEITVTDGDGVSGNPTISLPSTLDFTGKTINNGTFSGASIAGLTFGDGTVGAPSIAFSDDTDTGFWSPGDGSIAASLDGVQVWTLDGSGATLLGGTSSISVGGYSGLDQIFGLGAEAASVISRWSADTAGPAFVLGKSRGATVGAYTIVQNGDTLGSLIFAGTDSVDLQTPGASIRAEVDGSPGTNDLPGRLVFSTTADAGSSVTDRLILDAAGRLKPNSNDGVALGTSSLGFSDLFLATGAVIDLAAGDITLTHSTNALTLAGGTLVLPNEGLQIGASNPFSDSSGTLTLRDVDAIDATTEATIEAAIDTLANLTSVQGHTLTLTGDFIRSGAHSLTFTTSGATDVTLPTTGTLVSSANDLSIFAATTSAQLASVISDETGSGLLVFGTSPAFTTGFTLDSGFVIDWDASDVTLTHSANALTLAGGALVVPASNGFQVGSSFPFSDSSGTLTLQNVDVIDATTEATIEAAIDSLANLISIQGQTVTLTGAFVRSGAHDLTITTTGTTSVTLPTSGTLASSADNLSVFAATTSAQLAGVISDETGSGSLVFGTSPSFTTGFNLGSGFVINWNSADVTLTHSANALTLAGGSLVLPDTGLTVGASIPFSDSAGTLTLQNIDAIDATTETTIEAAIDTLANLTSVQGFTVTLSDPNHDEIFGWDDSVGAYKAIALGDLAEDGAPGSGDMFLLYGADGVLRVADYDNLPGGVGGGLASVVEDTSPQLGGNLDANGSNVLFDDATGIRDNSNNEQLIFQATASAVNYWEMTNAATGNAPLLQAVGSDTDVDAVISSQAAGSVVLQIGGTSEITLTGSALSPSTNDGSALGTTALGFSDLHLATGGVINWANGEVTLTETDANALTLAGGVLVLPNTGFAILDTGGDHRLTIVPGTNLTSNRLLTITTPDADTTITLSDPGFDVAFGWDDTAGAYKNFALADITLEASPASGDFLLMYGAEGDLRRVNWASLPGGASIGDGDYGDIVVSGSGTAWTIDTGVVTFAKMQTIATDRLLGRDTASTGAPEEISVGGGVEFSGSTSIQRSALTGDVTASAGSNTTTIADEAVTYAKMQHVTSDRLLGRDTGGTGDVEELTVGGGLSFTGSGGIQRAALTGDVTASAGSGSTTIASNVVTFAKMQQITSDRLLGRDTASTGNVEEISLGTGLEFSGSTSIQIASAYQAIGTQEIYISARQMTPVEASPPEESDTEYATNDVNISGYAFDPTTPEYLNVSVALPKQWNESTVAVRYHWTAASGSGAVVWGTAATSLADSDPFDTAWGTQITVTDTLLTAGDEHISSTSSAITIAGSPGETELQNFRIGRIANNGSDTLAADAVLVGITLFITTNAANDS